MVFREAAAVPITAAASLQCLAFELYKIHFSDIMAET